MPESKDTKYRLLPEWRIVQQGKSLLVTGGADACYEIELEGSGSSLFASLKDGESFTQTKLNKSDARVFEELVTAEIIVPILKKSKTIRVGALGDDNKLALNLDAKTKTVDFLLIIRTSSTYAELLERIKYQDIQKPHLFVDMAYHHTLSIGPLVFPGETACIACLQGRISMRWGDEAPPAVTKMLQEYSGVVSELVKTELNRIANNDTSLVNKTISWNFQDRIVKRDQLLKVPICPVCTRNKIDQNGALALPWVKDESTTNTI